MNNIVDIPIKNNKYRLKNKFTNEIIGPFVFFLHLCTFKSRGIKILL